MEKFVAFRLPFVLSAAKNSRSIVVTPDGRRFPKTNPKVESQWRDIKKIIGRMKDRGSWPDFGDDELQLELDYDVEGGSCLVRIRSLGPAPKGKTGRGHDIDNMLNTIQDGVARGGGFKDDRNIARVVGTRWVGGIVPG